MRGKSENGTAGKQKKTKNILCSSTEDGLKLKKNMIQSCYKIIG